MNLQKRPVWLSLDAKRAIFIAIVGGIVALSVGWIKAPERTWAAFLLTSVYFLCLSVSGILILSLLYVTGARWSTVLRKIPEKISKMLVYAGIPMLFVFFGMHSLYHWSHADEVAHDPILMGKAWYLNTLSFLFECSLSLGFGFYFQSCLVTFLSWKMQKVE